MCNYSYQENVVNHSHNFKSVVIPQEFMARIEEFASRIVDAKADEQHHVVDNEQELKRFTTGLMGEAALEILLGINIIDWNIGDSKEFHHPDIPGYSVGIKTVEKWKFPIIFKNNHYPQIICIKTDRYSNVIFVCGLASVDVLNTYQSDELIIDPKLRARGTKTGFWGFEHLIPVRSIKDIEQYRKE